MAAALSVLDIAAHIEFGSAGNAAASEADGWSYPEDRFTWTVGLESRVRLAAPSWAGAMALEILLFPLISLPELPSQRLIVAINGVTVGDEIITAEQLLGFAVPPEAVAGHTMLDIVLRHPNGTAPAALAINGDDRRLAIAVRHIRLLLLPPEAASPAQTRPALPGHDMASLEQAARFCTGLPVTDLVSRFESLGHNCEFGLAQRALGAEPLGLLRFAGISPADLLRGLESGFAGIEEPAGLHNIYLGVRDGRGEFLIRQASYDVELHTGLFIDEAESARVPARMAAYLGFLRRQLNETMRSASRIFLFHHPQFRSRAHVVPILNRLRCHGPNILVYMVEDDSFPAGTVVRETGSLFRGYTSHLRPIDEGHVMMLNAWASVCANTYRLWREQGGGSD